MHESTCLEEADNKFLKIEIPTNHLEVILYFVVRRLEARLSERAVWFLDLEMKHFLGVTNPNVSTMKEGADPKPVKRDMIQKGTGTLKALYIRGNQRQL